MRFFGKKEAILGAGLALAPMVTEAAQTYNNHDQGGKTIEVSAPVKGPEKKDAKTFNYEAHKLDSLVAQKIGRPMDFGAEALDSVTKANGYEAVINYKIKFEDLEKQLNKMSIYEGKTIRQALHEGLYISYIVPTRLKSPDSKDQRVSFDNIIEAFGGENIPGHNLGNNEEDAQYYNVPAGIKFAPINPAFAGKKYAAQLAELKKDSTGEASVTPMHYNDVVYMLSGLKSQGKLPENTKTLGRVVETATEDGQLTKKMYDAGLPVLTNLPNSYIFIVNNGEISISARGKNEAEEDCGIYVNTSIKNKQ